MDARLECSMGGWHGLISRGRRGYWGCMFRAYSTRAPVVFVLNECVRRSMMMGEQWKRDTGAVGSCGFFGRRWKSKTLPRPWTRWTQGRTVPTNQRQYVHATPWPYFRAAYTQSKIIKKGVVLVVSVPTFLLRLSGITSHYHWHPTGFRKEFRGCPNSVRPTPELDVIT